MMVRDFTLYDMLWRNAALYAHRPAVYHDQGQLTFGALLERVDLLSAGLAHLGITPGDRICILAQNHVSYVELYGACAKLGCIAYPINWRLTAEEVRRVLAQAVPHMMIVDETTVELVADHAGAPTVIPLWYIFGAEARGACQAFETLYDPSRPGVEAVTEAHDPFAVISTAAVDVMPRGAILTHANLVAANLQSMACLGLNDTDCNLLALPLFHVAALGSSLSTMHAGGANVLMTRFDTAEAVRRIDVHRVTYLTSFPPLLANILDEADKVGSQLASLRHVSGLEAPDTIQRLHATTSAQFWSGFGQTETSGFVTIQRFADHPGSAGRPGPLCKVRLVDDYDREVPVGTPGEILVQGPMIFQGYYGLPDVTEYTLRNGWHHTGDVGRFDDDGYLYYVKRKAEKELIKPGGENVYPAEVESVILAIDGVTGVCVFGVADAQWGEAIKAVVETRAALTDQQVIEYVQSRIARFKRPKWVEFTEALPCRDDGSIDRDAVQARWGDAG